MNEKPTKFKQNIISPEMIKCNTLYSITINPDDDNQAWNFTGDERIDVVATNLELRIIQFPNAVIDCHMEISRNGRLHFHGTILFGANKDILDFYLNRIRTFQMHYNLEIDTIDDVRVWDEYCKKSKHLIDKNVTTKTALEKRKKISAKNKNYKDISQWCENPAKL